MPSIAPSKANRPDPPPRRDRRSRDDADIPCRGGAAAPLQHSMALTASPPCEVSLYLESMSRPVSRMVRMT
jgi:hypothetical protein